MQMTVTVVAENRRPADICFKDLWQTFGQNEPTNEKPILNKSGGVVGITVYMYPERALLESHRGQ